MALLGKSELVEQLKTSAENMQRVRQRKETERAVASQSESEPRQPPTLDVSRRS